MKISTLKNIYHSIAPINGDDSLRAKVDFLIFGEGDFAGYIADYISDLDTFSEFETDMNGDWLEVQDLIETYNITRNWDGAPSSEYDVIWGEIPSYIKLGAVGKSPKIVGFYNIKRIGTSTMYTVCDMSLDKVVAILEVTECD